MAPPVTFTKLFPKLEAQDVSAKSEKKTSFSKCLRAGKYLFFQKERLFPLSQRRFALSKLKVVGLIYLIYLIYLIFHMAKET